jgi:hypothetical protein
MHAAAALEREVGAAEDPACRERIARTGRVDDLRNLERGSLDRRRRSTRGARA